MSSRVGIVTSSEVSVVRRDNRVSLALLDVLSIPLANARSTSVCEDKASKLLKGLQLTVTEKVISILYTYIKRVLTAQWWHEFARSQE